MATVELVGKDGEPMNDDTLLDSFIDLTARKRAQQDALNKLNKELDSLDREITRRWNDNGTQSVKRNGYTVYMKRDISAKAKDGDTAAIVDKLRRARLSELIGINHPRLKAWLKERLYNKHTDEWEINMDKLPPSFLEVMDVSEYFKLNCRKG